MNASFLPSFLVRDCSYTNPLPRGWNAVGNENCRSSRPGFGPVRPEPIAPGELLLLLHAEPTSLGHVSHSFQPRPAIGTHQVADSLSAAAPSAEPSAIRA